MQLDFILKEHQTCQPPKAKTIGTKWVLKKKRKPDGTIERYKARLVAQGYTQKKGVDFHDSYAPVARMTSIRVIVAIAAFLHGKIDTEVYLRQPPGFEDPKHPNKVYLLLGNLYGLRQAAKIWNDKFHEALMKLGLQQVSVDPCCKTLNPISRSSFPSRNLELHSQYLVSKSPIAKTPSLFISLHTLSLFLNNSTPVLHSYPKNLGRYNAAPTDEHWTMMKRLLRYINGKQLNGITFFC